MQQIRVFPTLLYCGRGLYKGINFKDHTYLGDVLNATRIYNDGEVDELCLLDIGARAEGRSIASALVNKVATECLMPLAVGGGISTLDHASAMMDSGAEKVVLNSETFENPGVVGEIAGRFGNQAVVISIDAKRKNDGFEVFSHNATRQQNIELVRHAKRMEEVGAGEILITSIDQEGRRVGYDLEMIALVSEAVSVPVIANGGAGKLAHLKPAIDAGAHALTSGSMFVFYGRRRAVLVNFPTRDQLDRALSDGGET